MYTVHVFRVYIHITSIQCVCNTQVMYNYGTTLVLYLYSCLELCVSICLNKQKVLIKIKWTINNYNENDITKYYHILPINYCNGIIYECHLLHKYYNHLTPIFVCEYEKMSVVKLMRDSQRFCIGGQKAHMKGR